MAYTQIQDVRQYDSEQALSIGMTSYRELNIAQRYPTWTDSLADGISTEWVQTLANGGTITASGGEGLLQTSANAAGSVQILAPIITYQPGQISWLNSAVRLGDTGSAGNIRRWGLASSIVAGVPQDGFYFELNGTTFNAVYVKAGAATATVSTSWSKFSTAPFTLDANYHGWEIRTTTNTVQFFIDNVLRHSVSVVSSPLTTTLNFGLFAQNINTSGATNRVLAIRNIGQGRFGSTPLTTNGVQKATYIVPINRLVNTALTANTTVKQVSLEHAATSTKTVRIRKIHIGALNTTAVAGDLRVFVDYGTAASSAGTVLTAQPTNSASLAADTVVKTLPTITSTATKFVAYIGASQATANSPIVGTTVYEWNPGSDEQQFILRAGILESLSIGIQSYAANVYHVTGYIVFTEE